MDSEGAVRLMFRHEGDDIALEAALRVDVRVLPTIDVEKPSMNADFYFELQTAAGRVLYRRLRPHPLGSVWEVPTGERDEPFRYRFSEEARAGHFSLLVPRTRGGGFVELFGRTRGAGAVRSLGRFEIGSAPDRWTPPLEGL